MERGEGEVHPCKGGIILRLVSLQKLCTVVSLRPHRRTGEEVGEVGRTRPWTWEGGLRRVEQKCCRTLNTTILYDHPVQRSPTQHQYLPSDIDSRLAVSWIEAKQTRQLRGRAEENDRWTLRNEQTERERKRKMKERDANNFGRTQRAIEGMRGKRAGWKNREGEKPGMVRGKGWAR